MSTGVAAAVHYPCSDGKPMAESDDQREAIIVIGTNLKSLGLGHVSMDHFVYPTEGDASVVQAPDVYVAVGRPQRPRPSYKVWEEDGVFPHVVFEVLSPNATRREMSDRRAFYFDHGAEEYYEYDPVSGGWDGHVRDANGIVRLVRNMNGHVSPRLGVRFAVVPGELAMYFATGERFRSFEELKAEKAALEAALTEAKIDAASERIAAREARLQAEAQKVRAEQALAENAALKAKLHAAGLNGD